MPHEVETMTYFGAKPWHGLGSVLDEAECYDWPAAAKKAGLDWSVELVPLQTADTHVTVEHRGVRRSTDGKVLGVVGPRFAPLQNTDAFGWFQPFLDAKEARLETAGALRGGSRVWVLAKIARAPIEIARDDLVEKFLLLSHGHDGSLAVRVGFTPVRVLCSNTMAQAHNADASKLVRLRHSKSLVTNLAHVREVMNLANQEFEATAEQYRSLARRDINQADLRKYVRHVLKVDDAEVPSARLANQVEQIIGLAEAGRGNDLPAVRGTWWAAYNGVSEWLGHNRGRTPATRLDSLWFGDGAALNKSALQIALDMAA
ncbi:DUF932 domain-containing protein [bacterium]|nr:DUF932 domain-containing protein [bacterium]